MNKEVINIIDKKNCNGCGACFDICPSEAIKMVEDKEGFLYPAVDNEKCIKCSKCVSVCPEINYGKISNTDNIEPICFVANHKNIEIRKDSTSGGAFTALAEHILESKGSIAGAIYNEDFSVRHIVTEARQDLEKLRSSKYLQSDCRGLYNKIQDALAFGRKVLICGCPCQMAALRLFLGKEYDNLTICDFICRGINSPKVFRKHLDFLEHIYGSKLVEVKAKNKEFGWKSLTFKAVFENGEIYYGDREKDNFTRGYLNTGFFCRPSCYDCKFKKIPRGADITLGDFWGVENVAPYLNDNLGTSVIMCNTNKGLELFKSVQDKFEFKSVKLDDVAKGNRHLYTSLKRDMKRRALFFKELDNLKYAELANKYFPIQKRKSIFKKIIGYTLDIHKLFKIMGYSPKVFLQFIWLNFLRKNTISSIKNKSFIVPTKFCIFDLHPSAQILVNGLIIIGFSKVSGSKLETRIKIDKEGTLKFEDRYTQYAGGDIQVFPGGKLTFKGGSSAANINCQIICADSITVGRDTLIGRNVVIRDYDAHFVIQDNYKVKAPITIGDHCWLGEGSMVCKGTVIGDGSIVAARSWVTINVKEKTFVAGVPARIFSKDIEWRQ